MKGNSYMIILFTVLCSCTQKRFDTEQALLKYLEKEGYIQQKTINGVDFTLMYRPTDLLVKQELGTISSGDIDSLRKKYKKQLYFHLAMSKNNRELLHSFTGNRNQFGTMVNRLTFGMYDKVHLHTAKRDTIPLVDYNYSRMYGISGATTMLFAYLREEHKIKEDYLKMHIEDIGLFTGEVTFVIPTALLRKEPILLFK